MSAPVRVKYTAPPTVGQFMRSRAFVRTIVGPLGSGKSTACNLEFLRRAKEQRPGPDGIRRTRFAAIRNTRPQLQDTTRKTFEEWIPHQLGEWSETDFTFHVSFGDVSSEVLFRALDKPTDVKKVLSLDLTGAYFNELREIPKEVFDGVQGRVGRYPSKANGGASWFGVFSDTNPWHAGHWLDELHESPPEGFEFFWQPDGLSPEAENVENLPENYYARLMHGKDEEWINVYLRARIAKADRGSYYGVLLEALKQRGGLKDFQPKTREVFTSWDLGHGDSTAIWWFTVGPDGAVDFIDHYENNSEPMSTYFAVIKERQVERGYSYARHWLPHDARAKTLQTGRSIVDLCIEEWGSAAFSIAPELSVDDGIMAGRWLLEQESTRFHPRCSAITVPDRDKDGLHCLRNYRRKWDENRKVYSTTPLHDWASHSADAYRYAALVAQRSAHLTRKDAAPPKPAARDISSFSLDEIWDTAPSRGGGRI